jgi:hypothetical protein
MVIVNSVSLGINSRSDQSGKKIYMENVLSVIHIYTLRYMKFNNWIEFISWHSVKLWFQYNKMHIHVAMIFLCISLNIHHVSKNVPIKSCRPYCTPCDSGDFLRKSFYLIRAKSEVDWDHCVDSRSTETWSVLSTMKDEARYTDSAHVTTLCENNAHQIEDTK